MAFIFLKNVDVCLVVSNEFTNSKSNYCDSANDRNPTTIITLV